MEIRINGNVVSGMTVYTVDMPLFRANADYLNIIGDIIIETPDMTPGEIRDYVDVIEVDVKRGDMETGTTNVKVFSNGYAFIGRESTKLDKALGAIVIATADGQADVFAMIES